MTSSRDNQSRTSAEVCPNTTHEVSPNTQTRLEVAEDLLRTLYLYIGSYEWKQLTTEQKEFFADVIDADRDPKTHPIDRWWR